VVTVPADEFLMAVDGSGVMVQWSREAEELVGCTAEEAVGQPVTHLVTGVAAGVRSGTRPGRAGVLLPGVGRPGGPACGCGPCGAGTALWDGLFSSQRGARL
jgi:hypothetical protein